MRKASSSSREKVEVTGSPFAWTAGTPCAFLQSSLSCSEGDFHIFSELACKKVFRSSAIHEEELSRLPPFPKPTPREGEVLFSVDKLPSGRRCLLQKPLRKDFRSDSAGGSSSSSSHRRSLANSLLKQVERDFPLVCPPSGSLLSLARFFLLS